MHRTKENISTLLDYLNSKYNIAATNLTLLPLGADQNASVYRAEAREGKAYFIKLKRGHEFDRNVTLLGLFQASGIRQVIPPIKACDGKQTLAINDFTLTVYPFIKGQNGFCCAKK